VQSLAARINATRVTATPDGARFAPPGALVGGSAAQVADCDLGVSVARLAVAETGSVLLASHAVEDRLVGMLARTHAIVVPAGSIVASLDEAAQALRRLTTPGEGQLRYIGFVTGPSRTADIERVLTIGVQGPRAVHVVVIEST
jgi:L-lactate dehydrogenase complex protein LldG